MFKVRESNLREDGRKVKSTLTTTFDSYSNLLRIEHGKYAFSETRTNFIYLTMVTHILWKLVLSTSSVLVAFGRQKLGEPKRNKLAIWELEGRFQRGIVIHRTHHGAVLIENPQENSVLHEQWVGQYGTTFEYKGFLSSIVLLELQAKVSYSLKVQSRLHDICTSSTHGGLKELNIVSREGSWYNSPFPLGRQATSREGSVAHASSNICCSMQANYQINCVILMRGRGDS
ncbi:uncharacterized protein F5891DRAFT_988292 [Suillus fuscotomentosus]|uniref:Uncharacterized protein n=1 Tax=Suillus fuscotomentosus TaxID=1912939 RepID=A0AAD4DP72_9AGAM|nr:uncharacterized protein F5891DRAFT_988292 [Suillus fuscotomentosus]KAG1887451.1 hypothetical protein F5891DRAFT_988292 [Suillus fuscotomentosus]